MWWPSENAEYNETSSGSECRYKCVDGYFWNDHRCNKPLPLGNICTGQTKCYDNSHEETDCPALGEDLFGQDAWYAENGYCAPKKFTIDSTVEDQKTVIDLNTGLEWQDIRGGSDYTWLAALEYCKNLTYAGFSDWRLPDLNELLSLINDDKISPASDLTNVAKMPYWTSTSSMTDPSEALYINFSTGRIGASDKTTSSSRYVKCVR
ncbi:DUF1566 domain-containing protein [bacterium]|nr:DUF1566 domain-containing protein [bacterium]